MKKPILILACVFISIFSFSQINLGKIKDKTKDKVNQIGNSDVPSTEQTNADSDQKACVETLELMQSQLITSREFLAEDDLDRAHSYIISAQNNLNRVKESKENNRCVINCEKAETNLAEVEAEYEQKLTAVNSAYDTQEADLEIVKKASWGLDDLKNQIDVGHLKMFIDLTEAELFLKNCKSIDYVNKSADVKAISRKYPEEFTDENEIMIYFDDFTVDFPKWLAEQLDFLKGEINNAMVEGNTLKARHVNFLEDAMNMAYAAVITADGCMILYPDNNDITKLRETAFANYQAIAKEFAATTYTSDIHAQNAGKIVFSTSPIKVGSENAASFKTSFTNTETVYAMMYLKSNLSSIQGTGFITTRIYLNGTQIAEHEWKASDESTKETFNEAEIMPIPATAETFGALKFYEAFSNSLLPSINKMKVCLIDDGDNIVAEGEFDLDCNSGTDDITSRYKELKSIRLEKVRMPKANISDPSLEASMISAMANQNWSEKAFKSVITGDSWITHRNALGSIIFREMYAVLAFKTTEGTCKIFYMSFKQDYNGGSYGKTKYYSVGGSEEIKCENVYK